MAKQIAETKTYRIRIEDRIFREGNVIVTAESAAEAALIARNMANRGEVEMGNLAYDRYQAVYRIEDVAQLGDGFGTTPNDGCLTKHLEQLLEVEGHDPSISEELNERYCDDEEPWGNDL